MSEEIRAAQLITIGRYAGIAKKFDPQLTYPFIACNVAERGINIAEISAHKFCSYWVLELVIRKAISDMEVFPLIEDHTPIKYKTTQEITEEEFAKFLSTAVWVSVD